MLKRFLICGVLAAASMVGAAGTAYAEGCQIRGEDNFRRDIRIQMPPGERRENLDYTVQRLDLDPNCTYTVGRRGERRSYAGSDSRRWTDVFSPTGARTFATCECTGGDGGRGDGGRGDGGRGDGGRGDGDGRPEIGRRGVACIAYPQNRFNGRPQAFRRDENDRLARRIRGSLNSIEVDRNCRAIVSLNDRPYSAIIDRSMRNVPPFIRNNAQEINCRCGR